VPLDDLRACVRHTVVRLHVAEGGYAPADALR